MYIYVFTYVLVYIIVGVKIKPDDDSFMKVMTEIMYIKHRFIVYIM